jgi:hypothetical protein
MLVGTPGVKPDRMIRRFATSALGLPSSALTDQALVDLVTEAAAIHGVSPTVADHAMWQAASGRSTPSL